MPSQISIFDGSTWQNATHMYIHTGSGAWPEAKGAWIFDGTSWQKGWPPITSASNWTDPDGTSDGINTITSTAGSAEVSSGNRLNISLSTPFSSINAYAYGIRLRGLLNSISPSDGTVSVDIDVSSDGGSYVTKQTHTIFTSGAFQDQTLIITSGTFTTNATGSIIVRPRLYVNNIDSVGTLEGYLYAFITVWNTDNYNVMWE